MCVLMLPQVSLDNKQKGGMLYELNQYTELLELRIKQMEQEFATQKGQLVCA